MNANTDNTQKYLEIYNRKNSPYLRRTSRRYYNNYRLGDLRYMTSEETLQRIEAMNIILTTREDS